MRRQFITTLCLLGLLLVLAAPPARAQSEIHLRVDRLDTQHFPQVQLLVTATDAQGRTIPGLAPESAVEDGPINDRRPRRTPAGFYPASFTIWEDGRLIHASSQSSTAPEGVAINVVLAIDQNCAVGPVLEQIKAAAHQFVNLLKPQDRVALVLLGNTAQVVVGFDDDRPDHDLIRNRIDALTPAALESRQALHDGAIESLRMAAEKPGGRRAVILFSDGNNQPDPSFSGITLGDVQQQAIAQRVPLYVVGAGQIVDQELRLLASDGRYLHADNPAELDDGYDQIARQLRQHYLITFSSTRPRDGRWRRLDLYLSTPNYGTATASFPLQAPFSQHRPKKGITVTTSNTPPSISFEAQSSTSLLNATTTVTATTAPLIITTVATGANTFWDDTPTSARTQTIVPTATNITTITTPLWPHFLAGLLLGAGAISVPLAAALALLAVGVLGTLMLLLARRGNPGDSDDTTPAPATIGPPGPTGPAGALTMTGPFVAAAGAGALAATPAAGPVALLAVERGQASPTLLQLPTGRETLIGSWAGADMVLDDPRVAARQALIQPIGSEFAIADLEEAGVVRVNGLAVRRVRLRHNDRIEIGDAVLVLKVLTA